MLSDWYDSLVLSSGRSASLWMMIGFLITYAVTRRITRKIRARSTSDVVVEESGPIKDIHIGGVHVHHQVWGILLVLVTGLLEFRFQPASPWVEILAALFGIGAALALDEFALWLHLEDVYWSDEGRKSIDAVMVAVVLGVALLIGATPGGAASTSAQVQAGWVTAVFVLIHIGYVVLCLLKGKIVTGLVGFFIPILALVGSIRLAKPESFWAKRWYGERKLERAAARNVVFDNRRERLRDRFGGAAIG
jgi:hypothetical protein